MEGVGILLELHWGGGVWRYLISSMDRNFFLMIEFHKYACSNLVAISEEVKDLDQAPG